MSQPQITASSPLTIWEKPGMIPGFVLALMLIANPANAAEQRRIIPVQFQGE